MGRHRFQEYQCIMSKVSRYDNVSLLKSIRSLRILYDHWVTRSDQIIFSSICVYPKLLPYCTRDFLLQKCYFKTFIHYRKHLIGWYTMIHWYINALIHILKYYASWYTDASYYHIISSGYICITCKCGIQSLIYYVYTCTMHAI